MSATPQDSGASDPSGAGGAGGAPVEPFASLTDTRRAKSRRGAPARRSVKAGGGGPPDPPPVPDPAPAASPAEAKGVAAVGLPQWTRDDTQELPIVRGTVPVAATPPAARSSTLDLGPPPSTGEPTAAEAVFGPRPATTGTSVPEPTAPTARPKSPKPPRPAKPPKPSRAPRPPKARKPRRDRLAAKLIPAWFRPGGRVRALRLDAIPVRVFATALVVALALFAIGTLRDGGQDRPTDTGAEQVDPVLQPLPAGESATPSASPVPSAEPSTSPKPKPGSTGDDEPAKPDDPPDGNDGGDDDNGGGKAPGTGSFRIKSVSSGLCLDESDRGDSTVVQKNCSSAPLSAEGLQSLGGGEYYLTTYHPDHGEGCISSADNGVGNGFIGDACTGDPSQVFTLDRVADGVYRIRLVDNGTCLAVSGGGAPVSAGCGKGENQRFEFV
ncbi:hypothetical protein AB0I28_08685 [Phytomonospora sp. NPDC050363]|uniref:RICIN domain-containing protein n=1 Tax=Phytomonospora sp. NPDC050363 TaxID=3155642 RepID=UPI0033C239B7